MDPIFLVLFKALAYLFAAFFALALSDRIIPPSLKGRLLEFFGFVRLVLLVVAVIAMGMAFRLIESLGPMLGRVGEP